MGDEQPGDGSGGDGGLGDDGDGPTKVTLSRHYLVESLGRTAHGLYGAGDVALAARALVTAGAGPEALRDLRDELVDLRDIIDGTIRAHDRIEIEEAPKP
jgi:hypothetical protein